MLALLLATILAVTQTAAQLPDDARYYSVSYVEVNPSSRTAALATLRQYRDAATKDSGSIRMELFEQMDRSGHFVILETWKTIAAFDARATARKQLTDSIQPIRLSDWDIRPYKTASVGPDPAEAGDNAVVVITHVDVSPDPSVGPMLRTLAESSRREAGNLRFDVLQHTMRANHFQIFETWQDRNALSAHAVAAHTRKYRDDVQRFLGSPLDERLFRPIR